MRDDFIEYLCCFIGMIIIIGLLLGAFVFALMSNELIMASLIAGLLLAAMFPIRNLVKDWD